MTSFPFFFLFFFFFLDSLPSLLFFSKSRLQRIERNRSSLIEALSSIFWLLFTRCLSESDPRQETDP